MHPVQMLLQVLLGLCVAGVNCFNKLPENVDKWCHELYKNDVPDECEDGWILCRGHCYFISHELGNWTMAEQDCLDRDAHLVSILYPEEQQFLSAHITDPFWIGLTDKENERTWEWSDGSPVHYLNWHLHQPDNNFQGQDCAQSLEPNEKVWTKNDEGRRWDDLGCEEEGNKHVCKKPTKIIHFTDSAQIQLGCAAFGSPKPRINWKKNGEYVSHEDHECVAVGDVVISRMSISLAELPSNLYTCVASNSHSLISSEIQALLSVDACEDGHPANYFISGFFIGIFVLSTVSALLLYYLHKKSVLMWCWSDSWRDAFPCLSSRNDDTVS